MNYSYILLLCAMSICAPLVSEDVTETLVIAPPIDQLLHTKSVLSKPALLEELLDKGANIHQEGRDGRSVLPYATL